MSVGVSPASVFFTRPSTLPSAPDADARAEFRLLPIWSSGRACSLLEKSLTAARTLSSPPPWLGMTMLSPSLLISAGPALGTYCMDSTCWPVT